MTFSQEWEQAYRNNTHISIWPWSDLVSLVMKYASPIKSKFRVLELGCGAGANIPFFTSLGVRYYAMDGSSIMIEKLRKKFPRLKENLKVSDFTQNIPFRGDFDLVIDRGSLTHNPTKGIISCLDQVHKKLKFGGKYIGIDWFSTLHSDYSNGLRYEDKYTRTGYQYGQFANVGHVHFSDRSHLQDLFSRFYILVLQHKIVKTEIPENFTFASWNLVAQKGKK